MPTKPTTTTRRAVLASLPIAAATLTPAAATTLTGLAPGLAISPGDDAELIALGAELDALHAEALPLNEASLAACNAAEKEARRRLGIDPASWRGAEPQAAYDMLMDVRRAHGTDDVVERADDVLRRLDAVYAKMMALPINTMVGAAVMARATVIAGGLSDYWSVPSDDLDWEQATVRNLIERLCASGGVPLPASDA